MTEIRTKRVKVFACTHDPGAGRHTCNVESGVAVQWTETPEARDWASYTIIRSGSQTSEWIEERADEIARALAARGESFKGEFCGAHFGRWPE